MDKKIRTYALIVLGICTSMLSVLHAYSALETFLCGNRAYTEKNWETALSFYSSMQQKGPSVWYNMGNCYYKLGDISHAIANWKRASHDATWSELDDIENNVYVARSKLDLSKRESYSVKIWERLAALIPILPAQILFIFLWCAVWLVSYTTVPSRMVKRSMIIVLLCMTVLLGSIVSFKHVRNREHAIVLQNETKILAGPHEGYQVLDVLACADEITVYEKRSGWYKVGGRASQGWIPATKAELI